MTKAELEKEAEESSFRYTLDKSWVCEVERKQIMAHFQKGYLAGAEPREKRIEELEMTVGTLRTFSNEQATCIERLEAQIEKMQDKLKSDLIARLKENMSYSTSPSCTKGMELFIKSIEEWEIKEK